jgi:DNA-binding response OmpR family regulator
MSAPLILIVDDDASIQDILADTLRDGGFETRTASSGEEAATFLKTGEPAQALVVDIGFGRDRVEGWSVARRARAFKPALPVLYITGGPTDEWSIHGVPDSILIKKPFAPTQILIAISDLLKARG